VGFCNRLSVPAFLAGLWVSLAVLLAGALPLAAGQPRISSPAGGDEIQVSDSELIAVRGGWAYRFPVTVEASTPISGVSINGDYQTVPYASVVKLVRAVRLQPGANPIKVLAFTDEHTAERIFTLRVEGLAAYELDSRLEAESQEILIFRPLDRDPEVVQPEELLEVPGGPSVLRDDRYRRPLRGGLMYEFVVEVSAFLPIREVRINGVTAQRPNETWIRAALPVYLQPGANRIHVEAVTDSQKAERTFQVRLAASRLPQTPFIFSASPTGTADGAARPE
jgi:hypothetical protein